ncbi:hypothetical protein CK203_014956 [Vitis vinifera]|uniref:Uncharacterized protein n=1 Tax=Vitis vinifera TaxID=29760 RepID=A0A438JDB3_VITVI|nr:hypothetical protein CK203_014956 [Vitis vinifera]
MQNLQQVSKLKINLEISTGKVDGIERLAGHSGPIDVYDRSFRLVELQVLHLRLPQVLNVSLYQGKIQKRVRFGLEKIQKDFLRWGEGGRLESKIHLGDVRKMALKIHNQECKFLLEDDCGKVWRDTKESMEGH